MLKAYEVVVENGQVKWLKEHPKVKSARAILTFLEEDVLLDELENVQTDDASNWGEMAGSEPQAQDIPRRRYDI